MGFKLRPGISAGNVTLTPGTNENFTGPEDHQAAAQVSVGQQQFISPGWQTWTVPNGVTSISAVLIAGGGGGGGNNGASGPGSSGGGGGGLRWINNLSVTPGEVLNIQVGSGGNAGTAYSHGTNGGSSAIQRGTDTLVYAGGGYAGKSNVSTGVLGGSGGTGSSIGGNIGGGNGGAGGPATTNSAGSGGGGAGGYSGNGGLGEGNGVSPTNGSGGGGAGARRINGTAADYTTGGGGVGFFGEGASGQTGVPAGSGSGGYSASNSRAGNYGGGGGGTEDDTNAPGLAGGQGAVRIIWPGDLREFPNTDTNDLDEIDGYSLSDSPNSVGPPVTNDAELHLNAYGSAIADGSRNSHSPTIVGYVPSNDDSPYEFGYSMEFGGTDNYITISNNNLNANWNDDFTLEAWVYATESSGDNIAFGEWGVGTRSFAVGILNGNFYFKYGASATVQTGSSVTLGQWYHLALTNVGGTKNLYVDGILDTSATADFVSTTHDFSIGASSYGGDQFNGRISDVRYTGSVVYEDDFVVPSERLRGYNISVAGPIPNPSISGFNTSYSLVQGEDLVVSGSVVDLPGDSFTWSFEELISSPYQPYASQGITVSQSDNLLTVSPGTEDATFQLNITATNSVGDSVSQLVDFTFVAPSPADVSWDSTSSTYGLLNSSSEVTMHSNLHSNTNNTFSQLWSEVDTGIYGIQKDGGISGLEDGLPSGTNNGYVFDDLIQFTLHGNPYTKGTTVKFWNNDLYMTHAVSGGWAYFMNFRGVDDNSSYGNFFAWASGSPNTWYMSKGSTWESFNRDTVGSGITGTYYSDLNNGWRQHKIQFSSTGYQWYVDDVLTYTSDYVSPGNEMRFNIIAGTGSGSATINRVKLHSLEIFVDGES